MFNLIRRISYGVIPRPDRPWEEDPTSNAPNTRRKRRISSVERDDAEADEGSGQTKKWRGDRDSATPSPVDADAEPVVVTDPAKETQEVKDVTLGVEEVDLSGTSKVTVEAVAPESVPLPEDMGDNLDDGGGVLDAQELEETVVASEDTAPTVVEKDEKVPDDAERVVEEIQKGVQGTPKKMQEVSITTPDVVEESPEAIPKTTTSA